MAEPYAKRDSSAPELAFATFEPGAVLATWRNVGISIWIDAPDEQTVRQAQEMLHELGRQYAEGVAFLQVIGEGHPPIDPGVRAALKELLRSGRELIREAPVVYEGVGFSAATVRAIVTNLFAQRSFGFPHRVYSSVDEAALAIGRRFEKREPARFARELCETLAAIRDRHHSVFPSAPQSFIRYRG